MTKLALTKPSVKDKNFYLLIELGSYKLFIDRICTMDKPKYLQFTIGGMVIWELKNLVNINNLSEILFEDEDNSFIPVSMIKYQTIKIISDVSFTFHGKIEPANVLKNTIQIYTTSIKSKLKPFLLVYPCEQEKRQELTVMKSNECIIRYPYTYENCSRLGRGIIEKIIKYFDPKVFIIKECDEFITNMNIEYVYRTNLIFENGMLCSLCNYVTM